MSILSIYTGTRLSKINVVTVTTGDREYALNPRLDLITYCRRGYEWGYTGNGPRQLALAILADCLGEDKAIPNIDFFTRDMIAGMPARGWSLTSDQIQAWYRERGRLPSPTVDETDAHDCEGR